MEPNGVFAPAAWHRRFWKGRGRRLFVLRVRGRLAGFALTRERAHFAGAAAREIGEFFVLRKYRRRGVGTQAARVLFRRFPGRWELAELTWNVAAQRFWRRVIRRVAVGGFTERRRRHGDLLFIVQHFETASPAPRRVRPASSGGRRRSA